ncbi:MAG: hypothetical protein H7839_15580 [Magnetococcus sp. YQC-5]
MWTWAVGCRAWLWWHTGGGVAWLEAVGSSGGVKMLVGVASKGGMKMLVGAEEEWDRHLLADGDMVAVVVNFRHKKAEMYDCFTDWPVVR